MPGSGFKAPSNGPHDPALISSPFPPGPPPSGTWGKTCFSPSHPTAQVDRRSVAGSPKTFQQFQRPSECPFLTALGHLAALPLAEHGLTAVLHNTASTAQCIVGQVGLAVPTSQGSDVACPRSPITHGGLGPPIQEGGCAQALSREEGQVAHWPGQSSLKPKGGPLLPTAARGTRGQTNPGHSAHGV